MPLNLPFQSIASHYRAIFGQKVVKLPVTIASDCPNRMGLKGMKICLFCDEWGSSAYPEQRDQSLSAQLLTRIKVAGDLYNARAFLAYYQAYTSTFLGLKPLRESFDVALQIPAVKGLIIGTRPDCISKAVLNTWQEYSEKTYVGVELGVQSFFDDQLEFLRRGHTAAASKAAIYKIKKESGVHVGIHLMFGLPGETNHHISETAKIVSDLPVDSVKLHNLHVLKNTPLEELYKLGEFAPIELNEYAERVALFLAHLRPDIAVERLSALAPRNKELIAPRWTNQKMATYQTILNKINSLGVCQGNKISASQSESHWETSQGDFIV